jgi:replicative DNA helicase
MGADPGIIQVRKLIISRMQEKSMNNRNMVERVFESRQSKRKMLSRLRETRIEFQEFEFVIRLKSRANVKVATKSAKRNDR